MEKITYSPLVDHLKKSEERYDQLYREAVLRYGAVDKLLLTHWMVSIIEPIIRLIPEERISKVFLELYSELLQLLGSQRGIIYEQEYQAAWLICKSNPSLIEVAPYRIIKAIDSALDSIRTFKPLKANEWIILMSKLIPQCKTVDEFLACGRIGAWMCGLAHLRIKSMESLNQLPGDLRELITANKTGELSQTWSIGKTPRFIKEVGGFRGMNGPFIYPPQVALVNDTIFVADARTSCALFIDSFGDVLLPDVPLSADEIIRQSNVKAFEEFKKTFGKDIVPFDDISSCVVLDSTLIISRHTSHYLFVYGWSN